MMNHGDREAQGSTAGFLPLPKAYEPLTKEIISIAITIHKRLGPGLLESIYEKCFCYELNRKGIAFQRQVEVPIVYDDIVLESALRLDLIVEDCIVIEFKAQDEFHPVWEAQLLSYLRLTGKRLGYILNFHVPVMTKGINRRIL